MSNPIEFATPEINDDDVAAVERVLRSGWLTTGRECAALEQELGEYLAIDHVVAMSSCTAALDTAIAYLQLPHGSRVAVPTWTFASTALAVVRNGAEPVLCDIDPDTLNLSPSALGAALDAGIDAVVGVHFGGVAMARDVHDLCAVAGVPLVEDAAHALGAQDHRGRVAGQGTAGACFSFYATKNLTSAEGGALATDDGDLAAFARSFRLHGLTADAWRRYDVDGKPAYDLEVPGIKANLPDVLAALARSQLTRFDSMQARRRSLVVHYREQLATIDGVVPVPSQLDERGADHLMAVLLPEGADRDGVLDRLRAEGIVASVHFRPLHGLTWFRQHCSLGPGGVPVADRLAGRALTLPLHPRLSDADVDRVCDALGVALEQSR